MASQLLAARGSRKRENADRILDSDTLEEIQSSKKPKIELNPERKAKCLTAITLGYMAILKEVFGKPTPLQAGTSMEVDEAPHDKKLINEAKLNINVGNHIISIIFTLHNILRQGTKQVQTNMIKKTAATSFKIMYLGKEYLITTDKAKEIWLDTAKKAGLDYKSFDAEDKENWYGTMGPYLDMFSAYALRQNELRLGHNNMPMLKKDGKRDVFPVSRYGLSGAHHVLLEGTSFPPERRSSIVQSLGPMTAWLCMIRSEGIYRRKYATAVKRALSHIPCIDDLIEITKNNNRSSDASAITTIIAEILLVTTSRQATRMYFPITVFSAVYRRSLDTDKFLNFFSTTGAGGWYTYKIAASLGKHFTLSGQMEEEKAAQVVFHGIFGIFKEDLSILEQISDVGYWYTREELGTCFLKQVKSSSVTQFKLPTLAYYSKMSCANQTGLLAGVYNQVVAVPCFSGVRKQIFGQDFFEHIKRRHEAISAGKSMPQILSHLTSVLEGLHEELTKRNGVLEMGTTLWMEMSTLDLDKAGAQTELILEGTGKMFLGKRDKK